MRDFKKTNVVGISERLGQTLHDLTVECDPNKPVYSFKEVVVNRLQNNSRRADVVLYIPGERIIYIEYKTIETEGVQGNCISAHGAQLKETHDNLVANLTYRLSVGSEFGTGDGCVIPVTTLLVSRRFWTKKLKDDVVTVYKADIGSARAVREPGQPSRMVHFLSSMGKMCAR